MRYDIKTVREYTNSSGEIKKSYQRIGTMFENRSGSGFTIVLEAIPLCQIDRDGRVTCKMYAFEPDENRPTRPAAVDNLDDQIPF